MRYFKLYILYEQLLSKTLSRHEPLSLRRYMNVENILYIIAELCLNLARLARKRKELMIF